MKADRATVSIVKDNIVETPEKYTDIDLQTVRKMIEKSIELIGGLESILGNAKTVVVKPNLVEVPFKTTGGSVVTDPRVLEAAIGMLKDYGIERVIVAEGKSVNLKHIASGPVITSYSIHYTKLYDIAAPECRSLKQAFQ